MSTPERHNEQHIIETLSIVKDPSNHNHEDFTDDDDYEKSESSEEDLFYANDMDNYIQQGLDEQLEEQFQEYQNELDAQLNTMIHNQLQKELDREFEEYLSQQPLQNNELSIHKNNGFLFLSPPSEQIHDKVIPPNEPINS